MVSRKSENCKNANASERDLPVAGEASNAAAMMTGLTILSNYVVAVCNENNASAGPSASTETLFSSSVASCSSDDDFVTKPPSRSVGLGSRGKGAKGLRRLESKPDTSRKPTHLIISSDDDDDDFVEKPPSRGVGNSGKNAKGLRGKKPSASRKSTNIRSDQTKAPILQSLLTTPSSVPAKRRKVVHAQVNSSESKNSTKSTIVVGNTAPEAGPSSAVYPKLIVIQSESDSESEFIFSQPGQRDFYKQLAADIKEAKANEVQVEKEISKQRRDIQNTQALLNRDKNYEKVLDGQLHRLDSDALQNAEQLRQAQEAVERIQEQQRIIVEDRERLLGERGNLLQTNREYEVRLQEQQRILECLGKKEWMRKRRE